MLLSQLDEKSSSHNAKIPENPLSKRHWVDFNDEFFYYTGRKHRIYSRQEKITRTTRTTTAAVQQLIPQLQQPSQH